MTNKAGEIIMRELTDSLGETGRDQMVAKMIGLAVSDQINNSGSQLIQEVAGALKCEEKAAMDAIEMVAQSVPVAAAEQIKAAGYEGAEVMEFVLKECSETVKSHLLQRMALGDRSALRDAVRRYELKERY
jgi:hypothetical protein